MKTKEFYSRESKEVAQQVREALKQGYRVVWNTAFETFYGVSWANWATKELEGIRCEIHYKNWDRYNSYWRELEITPL